MFFSAVPLLFILMLSSNVMAMEYKGNSAEDFQRFIQHHQLDWPKPKKIDYFQSDDRKARIRYAHWTPAGPTTGTVIHFNGRTEFIERNIYSYKDLLEKGYEIWTLDWRGQGLSSRNLSDKQKHDIQSFDDYLSDANHFIEQIIRLKDKDGKKILLAHSMGGQIALRYLLQPQATKFDYAVLSSPLLQVPGDNNILRKGNLLKKSVVGSSCVITKSPTWQSDFQEGEACRLLNTKTDIANALTHPIESKQYSNDARKLAEINCLIESSINANGIDAPDLRLACPTSNWLSAAFDSTDITQDQAANLQTPIMIIRADPDNAVVPEAQDSFCKKAQNCQVITAPKFGKIQPGHELLIEIEPIRKFFFDQFDNFVKQR